MLHRLLALVVLLFSLNGCATGFSPYSISEGELENHLKTIVANYDKQQLQNGSPFSLSLDNADITLGPDGRDVAIIDVGGQVAINAFLTKLPVDLKLKMEGAPVYDAEEKAIFLRRLKLLDSEITTPFFGGNAGQIKQVTDTAMGLVSNYLENVPIYRLDESSPMQRMFGAMGMSVRVAPGRLEFYQP